MAVLTEELNPVCVGIDVGQIHDPTAICVSEVKEVHTGKFRYTGQPSLGGYNARGEWVPATGADPVLVSEYTVRHIGRLPLGMSYPEVAVHIANILCSDLLKGRKVRVLIDVTGVGRPVYEDLLKEISIRKHGLRARDGFQLPSIVALDAIIKPISFVHGESYNHRTGSLGKAYLVSRLQSLLQAVRIHAPDTPEARATLDELRVYEIKVNQDGKDQYGAFQVGKHDDLATALGLSVLEDPIGEKVRYSKRVY